MRKLTQLELLEEGFLDAVRRAGGIARAAVKGAAKGIYAMDPGGFDTIAAPFKTIAAPITGALKQIKQDDQIIDPKQFVLQELKLSYYKTFNPKSVEIIEVKKDTTAQRNVIYLPKVNTKTNRFIVSFSAERFLPTGGSAPSEIYYAYVFKGGEKNGFSMDVRDNKGNEIRGEKSKTPENPTFNKIIKNYQSKSTPITVALLSTIITKTLGISEREYANKLSTGATNMDDVIMDITNKTAVQDVLEQDDIDRVYEVLKTRGLTEKVKASQKVLIEQLKKL